MGIDMEEVTPNSIMTKHVEYLKRWRNTLLEDKKQVEDGIIKITQVIHDMEDSVAKSNEGVDK